MNLNIFALFFILAGHRLLDGSGKRFGPENLGIRPEAVAERGIRQALHPQKFFPIRVSFFVFSRQWHVMRISSLACFLR